MTSTAHQIARAAERVVLLTPRQTEVLKLTALGLSQKEMCDHLKICPGALYNRIKLMRQKLGIYRVAQETRAAIKAGIIKL